jgi:ribosomal-protein-alanine N-acetyltransferase
VIEFEAENIRIRPMKLDDLAEIEEIEKAEYTHPWTIGNFSDSLASGYDCLVCQLQEKVIGYAVQMFVVGESQILNITLGSKFQRLGYGRTLLERLVAHARDHDATVMLLEVRESNKSAIGFYEAMGFTRNGRRPNYYQIARGREDAVLMERAV